MDRKCNIITDENTFNKAVELSPYYSDDLLTTASNKGTFKRAVKDLENIGEIEMVYENETFKVKLSSEEIIMDKDISKCKCSCQAKVTCRHIVAAGIIINSLGSNVKTNEVPEEMPETETVTEQAQEQVHSFDRQVLNDVISASENIMTKGFINCTSNDCEVFENLSLRIGSKFKMLSNLCRSCAENIKLMNEKNAAFKINIAAENICCIHNTAAAAMGRKSEKFFEEQGYKDKSIDDFFGLGAYPFVSKSGYIGVTAVLFSNKFENFFTFTRVLPTIYDEEKIDLSKIQKLFLENVCWQNKASMQSLIGTNFSLINLKTDDKFRISSSKKTTCVLNDYINCENISPKAFEIPSKHKYNYFFDNRYEQFLLIKNPAIENVQFIKSEQKLIFSIISDELSLPGVINYSQINKNAIDYIEEYDGKKLEDSIILLKKNRTNFMPISFIKTSEFKVTNIFF